MIEAKCNKKKETIFKVIPKKGKPPKDIDSEIKKIKYQIFLEKENNKILSNKLKEEKEKKLYIKKINDEGLNAKKVLEEIANFLQVENIENIIPKIKNMIEYINDNLYDDKNVERNELISNLKKLYLNSNNDNDIDKQISLKILWRWIKNLVNIYNTSKEEKNKLFEEYDKMNSQDSYYKVCCLELMNEFHIDNIYELNNFIEGLVKSNEKNKKRVLHLKKILEE